MVTSKVETAQSQAAELAGSFGGVESWFRQERRFEREDSSFPSDRRDR
jgi:hypothetical protein